MFFNFGTLVVFCRGGISPCVRGLLGGKCGDVNTEDNLIKVEILTSSF